MTVKAVCRWLLALTLVGVAAAPWAAQTLALDQDTAEVARLIKALDLRPGSVVAEIGAGDGELTLSVARIVGEAGRVFSNELNGTKLAALRAKMAEARAGNVTVIEGRANATSLPDQCCDGIYMRDVYHHFSDPAAMNASIMRALRPGGRLVILEFGPPPGSESPDVARRGEDGQHGITPATLERELKAAGLTIESTEQYEFRSSITVARRP
jgi:ubiquinone/menaquinone biosynthesis C-methylase UbiE